MQRTSHVIRVIHRLGLPSLCVFALLASTPLLAADTRYGIDAELLADDNINRGQAGYEKSDTIVSVEGSAARSFLLSTRSGLNLRGALRYENFTDFGDLSNLSLLGRVAYVFQPNPGFSGTKFEIAGWAQAVQYSDSDIRDGYLYSISGALSKHVTDRVRLGAGASYNGRKADTGDVYDLSNNSLWISADYRLRKTTLYGSWTMTNGDQVITTVSGSYPGLDGSVYEASAIDTAFAGDFFGATPWAYRLEAQTMVYELGVNVPIRGNQALDFSAVYFDSEADKSNFTYDGVAVRAIYFYRF